MNTFYVRQRFTVMVNKYEIVEANPDGSEGRMLAFALDFVDKTTRAPVLSSMRQRSIRDRYLVTVTDPRLDFRLAASMAEAVDTFQGR